MHGATIDQMNNALDTRRNPTIEKWRNVWINNAAENLRRGYVAPCRSLLGLKDKFIGEALLCAPGPSLDRAIPFMREATAHHNIIAVNSSLNPLCANKLFPFLTVILHPETLQAGQVQEVARLLPADSILAAPVTIHPDVVAHWPGQVFFFTVYDPSPLYEFMRVFHRSNFGDMNLAEIPAGGCCITSAFDVAYLMGLRRFALIGIEMGGLSPENVDAHYGQRYRIGAEIEEAESFQPEYEDEWHNWTRNELFRLAFESRYWRYRNESPDFHAVNLSPWSLLELPYMEMMEYFSRRDKGHAVDCR